MASDTASTTPLTSRAPEADGTETGDEPVASVPTGEVNSAEAETTGESLPAEQGSLARRMALIAAGWIAVLLLLGGVALDRTLTNLVTRNYDEQLEYMLTAMIGSAEIDPGGEVWFNRVLGDQRFLEPNSGLYWQINGEGYDPYASRSLWDRTLSLRGDHVDNDAHFYNSNQFASEPLRMVERTVILPGSETRWTFAVGSATGDLDGQIAEFRAILAWSFAILGLGLFGMTLFQVRYGLSPLRRVRAAIQRLRTTGANRITEPLPTEVQPLVQELNELLEHSERQAEEARTHAGNLAHALKTPLTVVNNAATAQAPDLADTVVREARTMRRHVDHHLARARAVGRRAIGRARTPVCESAEAVRRAIERLYPEVRFDIAGNRAAQVAIERQDLDEILGNLIENAAKYGGGSVFVTVDAEPESQLCTVWIEDDGAGIPPEKRDDIFSRGARLDTDKPGTGLGLAIVRDVAKIYGGEVELGESEDLGGLLVRLALPRIVPSGDGVPG